MRTALIIKSMSLLALLKWRSACGGYVYQSEQYRPCINGRVVLCICCRWLCSCRQQEKDLNPPAWVLPLTPAARGLACQFPSRCYIASSPCRSTVAGSKAQAAQRHGKAS